MSDEIKTPTFNSTEEMMEWLDQQAAEQEKAKKEKKSSGASTGKSSSRKKKGKPSPKDSSKNDTSLSDGEIWSVVHFYTRSGLSPQSTLLDAKEEKEVRNDNVIVAYHDHEYGTECSNNCRQV